MIDKRSIVAIVYSVLSSITIIVISFMIPNTIMKNIYIPTLIKSIMMIFIAQISAIVHELGHFSQTNQIANKDYVDIDNKFYIPLIGFIWSFNVSTVGSKVKNDFNFSIMGFLIQFLYLTGMTLLIFKGSMTAVAIVLFVFISYMFIYARITKGTSDSDFSGWS
jgi:hypothetical protein